MLDLQKKETGFAYWACRSCMNFAAKMNANFQEYGRKIEELEEQVKENREEVAKANDGVKKVEKKVEKVEKKMEDVEKKMEEGMCEEMRAREAIRRNIIIHGVKEPDTRLKTDKERMDADLDVCDKIFRATGGQARRRDIRFCRRIGERSQAKRPILVGMKTESIKSDLLDAASQLQKTEYKDVTIGPDQTKKQRKAEANLKEVVERKNREELSEQDKAKNLQWMVIGRKGEKRVVKAQVREETYRRGREQWREDRDREGRYSPVRRQENRQNRGAGRYNTRQEGRQSVNSTDLEDDRSKRGRSSEQESGEEMEGEPPKSKSRQ